MKQILRMLLTYIIAMILMPIALICKLFRK